MPMTSAVQPSVQIYDNRALNWGTQKWANLTSSFHADSKGQWSLAQKVGVFSLCALGIWILSKMFRVNHSVIRTSSHNSISVIQNSSTRADVINGSTKFTNGPDSLPLTTDSGEIKVKNLSISAFHAIQLNVPGDFTIAQGVHASLSLIADKNIAEKLRYRISAETLIIEVLPQTAFETKHLIQYTIIVPNDLNEIKVSSSAQVTIPHLDGDVFRCTIEGAGKVLIQSGQVRKQEISVNGTGSYNAGSVLADHSIVKIQGAGNAHVKARQILNVKIEGAGTCTCDERPAEIKQQVSLTGKLTILNVIGEAV
jgi:hypothetical protein